MRSEISVAGADIRVLSIDVDSIGAGGGSIASVRGDRELQVGPRSAGSTPGPACYGRNGVEPTATDADLVLGVLDPETFLGGRMRLDVEAARRAIDEHIARPLGLGVIEAAWGIRKILDSRMADLLRRMTVQRGYDPRDFTLFANGGAGPSHAWVLSAELGLDGFVVPAAATVQSAYGSANAHVGFTTERPAYVRLAARRAPTSEELGLLNARLQSALAEVSENLQRAKATDNVAIERYVSIRFRGQTNHLDVPVSTDRFGPEDFAAMTALFQRQYEAQFGRGASYANAGFEVLAVRVVGIAKLPPSGSRMKGAEPTRIGTRDVVFEDPARPVATAIYATSFPAPGSQIAGPAIIEFPGQSVVIPPGASAKADDLGNLHVRIR
jgi:N-methylhydantoinase A